MMQSTPTNTLPVLTEVVCCAPALTSLPARDYDTLSELFKALADPARVQIVHILQATNEPVCVCDLTDALSVSQPTVSHHLAKLREAGLVTSTKRGTWAYYEVRPDLSEAARAALAIIR